MRAEALARVLVPKARQFVAAANAIAVASCGSRLDWYESHVLSFPLARDTNPLNKISQQLQKDRTCED